MIIRICILVSFLTAFVCAEPASNIGAKCTWITNGRWEMRVNQIYSAANLEQFRSLPFTEEVSSTEGGAYRSQVDRLVFGKGGSLLVLDVSLKNVGDGVQKIGFDTPSWVVRCMDGQEVRNTGSVSLGANKFLTQPLQKFGPVPSGKEVRGTMAFVLPANTEAKLFFFKAAPSVEKYSGKSESLVSRLGAKSSGTAKALTPNRPTAEWQGNAEWKMRLSDVRSINDISAYRALPWGDRLQGAERDKHYSYVERNVYAKGGRVLLVRVEAKNLAAEKREIGYEIPFWQVEDSSGKALRLSGVYQQQVGWAMVGGLAKKTLLNPKDTAAGFMGFFLPPGFEPHQLSFQVPKSLEKKYGPTGSLNFKL